MHRIRSRCLVEAPGQYEIRRAIARYLLRQMLFDYTYRLGLCRY